MGTIIMRPNATMLEPQAGSISPTGTTARNRVNDGLDATFVNRVAQLSMLWRFGYATPSVPSDEFVARVGASTRARIPGGLESLSHRVYRAEIDTKPMFVYQRFLNSTFSTFETGTRFADWLRASMVNLESEATDLNGKQVTNVDYADYWVTLYTVQTSVATPQVTTMTVTNQPTVPVNVLTTLGWESTVETPSPLRKVSTTVRIEPNASTGAGNLPALLEVQVDDFPVGSGTVALQVLMPGDLANGTYKSYARSRRYSEASSPANAAEMFGAWSAAATLTMSVTAMGVPTLTVSADNAERRGVLTVTVPTTAPYVTATTTVERSNDAGVTWSAVRGLIGKSIAFATATVHYDYEAPLGVAVLYRALAVGTRSTGESTTSQWTSSVSVTLAAATTWILKTLESPTLNLYDVTVVGDPTEIIGEDLGIFRALDRRYPVVVAGELTGWDGELQVETVTNSAWVALRKVIEVQGGLLLQSPFGWQKYIRLVGGTNTAIMGTPTQPRRRVALSYVEIASS